jgi:hypothetical protein
MGYVDFPAPTLAGASTMFLRTMQFLTRRAPLLLLLPALTLASGCGRYTRTKQCRALIAQINPGLDDVLTLTHGGEAADAGVLPSGAYVAAAGRYERLAKQLGPMEFASEDMAKNVAEYAGLLSGAATSLRAVAAGLDTNNAGEAERANRELERISGRERAVIARMEVWCQP